MARWQRLTTAPVSWLTNSRVPLFLNVAQEAHALLGEERVAHRQRLVDDQDVGVDVGHHSECQADHHPARIGLDRLVDELADVGELDDAVVARVDLRRRQAQDRAVQIDVLAPGELRVEARAQLQQRADAAAASPRRLRSAPACRR